MPQVAFSTLRFSFIYNKMSPFQLSLLGASRLPASGYSWRP